MLLKYLYNNYRLSRLFLCSVPSNKAFDLETNEEKAKQLQIVKRQILTQQNMWRTHTYNCYIKICILPVNLRN